MWQPPLLFSLIHLPYPEKKRSQNLKKNIEFENRSNTVSYIRISSRFLFGNNTLSVCKHSKDLEACFNMLEQNEMGQKKARIFKNLVDKKEPSITKQRHVQFLRESRGYQVDTGKPASVYLKISACFFPVSRSCFLKVGFPVKTFLASEARWVKPED